MFPPSNNFSRPYICLAAPSLLHTPRVRLSSIKRYLDRCATFETRRCVLCALKCSAAAAPAAVLVLSDTCAWCCSVRGNGVKSLADPS
jgi:hypothetical protein